MNTDLTNSSVVRQNILNNRLVFQEVQKAVSIKDAQIVSFFEPTRIGYEALEGKILTEYKLVHQDTFGDEKGFVTKTTLFEALNFRAFLNNKEE